MRASSSYQHGYSVVELVAVTAIASITLTMALQLSPNAKRDSDTERAAEQLVADVKLARMRAVSSQVPTTVSIYPQAGRYIVTPGGIDRTLAKGLSLSDPLVTTVPPPAIEFEFEARGLLAGPSPISLQLKGHDHAFKIAVSPGGQVRMANCTEPGK